MINLFHIPSYNIDTSSFSNLLHDNIVKEFEEKFCDYVGAKHACTVSSATNAIFLAMLNKNQTVSVPSVIPPVVCNAIITSGNRVNFVDNTEWVGDSYILHRFQDYKIIDSAQKVEKDQYKNEANDEDLMIFSFYPTKPIGSCDGGIIVSNDENKINWFKEATLNGMSFSKDNWERKISFPGYKMYMNSIQAYIAEKNLKALDAKNEELAYVRDRYNKILGLNNTSGHLYRLNVNNRDEFVSNMKKEGIQIGVHYTALHENKIYNDCDLELNKSSFEGKTTVSLPFNERLSGALIEYITEKVNKHADRC